MLNRIITALLLLFSLSFSITVVSPFEAEVREGDILDLGTIGPGQTVFIEIDPIVTEGGIHGIGGQYDMAIADDLPREWSSEKSKLYGKPLQVTITADPDAPEGNYSAWVKVIDENNGEKLGNISFTVRVEITWDVMDFNVTPSSQVVGPGQPGIFDITITNKGSTSDAFQISATGAKRWEFKKPVFVPPESSKTITYEISGEEEERYDATISVVSLASDNIADEKNVTLFIKPSLFGDYGATNNGVLIFPIFQAPIHSLAGIFSNFLA